MEIRLSSRFADGQKWMLMYLLPALMISLLLGYVAMQENSVTSMLLSLPFLQMAYLVHSRSKKIYPMTYTVHHLLVRMPGQEMEIPLSAIQEVTLKTANGGYEIRFYPGEAPTDRLFFLPSLLYPLNFKKMDARVEDFRKQINKAKQATNPDLEQAALTSNVFSPA